MPSDKTKAVEGAEEQGQQTIELGSLSLQQLSAIKQSTEEVCMMSTRIMDSRSISLESSTDLVWRARTHSPTMAT